MTKSAFIIGANGFIGNAVTQAFVCAGWQTFGLVRKSAMISSLESEEIDAVLGSVADQSFLDDLFARKNTFDVIASCTEDVSNFKSHFDDILKLLGRLAAVSNSNGVRPLVIFTSGCKDYGQSGLHGDVYHKPHTEDDPINPPDMLAARANNAPRIFDCQASFDAVLLRPTLAYGRSSSYYGLVFDRAQEAAATSSPLAFNADPNTVMHGTHVDDVAEAYVLLAKADMREVNGKCFNIAAERYDTLQELADALVKEYGIQAGVQFRPAQQSNQNFSFSDGALAFSQWVDSRKVRKEIGWSEKRRGFVEGISTYRRAYEAASEGRKMRTMAKARA